MILVLGEQPGLDTRKERLHERPEIKLIGRRVWTQHKHHFAADSEGLD